jgi:hypothetical protein
VLVRIAAEGRALGAVVGGRSLDWSHDERREGYLGKQGTTAPSARRPDAE